MNLQGEIMNQSDINNKNAWKKAIQNHIMLYPSEHVARFLGRNYSKLDRNILNKMSALDIGTGSGRNLKAMLDYGFQAYGIDYVNEACDVAKNILQDYENLKEIYCGDFAEYNFNMQFDVIVIFGLIFFRDLKSIKHDLSVLNKLLKNNGKMCINFRSKYDYLYNTGKKIDDNTFILEGEYNGATYSFFDLDEVKELLTNAGFKIENMEREDYYKDNLSKHNSWWILQVTK